MSCLYCVDMSETMLHFIKESRYSKGIVQCFIDGCTQAAYLPILVHPQSICI